MGCWWNLTAGTALVSEDAELEWLFLLAVALPGLCLPATLGRASALIVTFFFGELCLLCRSKIFFFGPVLSNLYFSSYGLCLQVTELLASLDF